MFEDSITRYAINISYSLFTFNEKQRENTDFENTDT